MKLFNESESTINFLHDSTAASSSTGSYSSANEGSISSIMRNAILIVESVEEIRSQSDEYAAISKIDRERIKKAYPKPSLAKPPMNGIDLDIV